MADIYLDPLTKDINWDEPLRWCSKTEEYVQRIRLAWMLNLGEFFSHANYGLPWIKNEEENLDVKDSLRYFLGDDRFPDPEEFIAAELDEYTENIPFVESVESTFTFDKANRVYSYTANIVTVDGEEVNLPPYLLEF